MTLNFLYSLREDTYLYDVKILLKTLFESLNKICYITLNKTGESIKKFCAENNLDESKVVIIDMISPRIRECENTGNLYYVNMQDLAIGAKETIDIMKKENCNSFILDSLSTLSIYYDDRELLRFVHEILVFTESNHLISNIIIQRNDEKKPWVQSIEPIMGEPKKMEFTHRG